MICCDMKGVGDGMICPKCGSEITDDSEFCNNCGMKQPFSTVEKTTELPVVTPETTAEFLVVAPETTTEIPVIPPEKGKHTNTDTPPRRPFSAHEKDRIGAIVMIVLLVAGFIFAGVRIKQRIDDKSAEEAAYAAAHAKTYVVLDLVAPGYNSWTDSKIPMHVTGIDFEGNTVDEDDYVSGDGTGINLMRGSYNASVEASPLMANATIYDIPDTVLQITIDEDGLNTASSSVALAFTVTDAASVTDEQVIDSYSAALASGMDTALATSLKNSTLDARQKAAAELAAQKAADDATCLFSSDYFDISTPASWSEGFNYVMQTTSDSATCTFYRNGYSDASFLILVTSKYQTPQIPDSSSLYASVMMGTISSNPDLQVRLVEYMPSSDHPERPSVTELAKMESSVTVH